MKLKDILRRSEMVFVNGTPLDQALSHSELQAGRFYVDENTQTLYIQPARNISISGAAVEVAVRPELFYASGKNNLVSRGIIFQHVNTALDQRAVEFYDSSNILVEDCQFRWNNWRGLGLELSRNVTTRRNGVSRNGGAGIVTYKTRTETGIYLEANQRPITIESSRICRNRQYGILIANSARVNLKGNNIHGNAAN